MTNRTYTAKHQLYNHGEFKGLEAYADVWVEDQNHTIWASEFVYRRDFKSYREFLKAIDTTEQNLKLRRLA